MTGPQKEKRKPGRPRADIDDGALQQYLATGPSMRDTYLYFNISEPTLIAYIKRTHGMSFAELRRKCMDPLVRKLRHTMIEKALNERDYKALQYCLNRWDEEKETGSFNLFPYAPPPSMREDSDEQDDD